MTTATIVKLKAPAAKPARSRATSRKLRRQAAAAAGVGGVACVLTALSLNHLARGIGMVTGAAEWEAWSMAAGIDLGFVSLELAQSGAPAGSICAARGTLGVLGAKRWATTRAPGSRPTPPRRPSPSRWTDHPGRPPEPGALPCRGPGVIAPGSPRHRFAPCGPDATVAAGPPR
jgi:hypothetical protein